MITKEQERALDCSRSKCVTAGAGAGKTFTLVNKYIHLIENGVSVSEILALTFTEKAAAEMKHKVRKAIISKEGTKWDKVKDEINWCKISTFHSFCADVIRQYPLETGVSPGFQVLEEVERDELLAEALDQLISPPIKSDVERALVRLLTDIPTSKLKQSILYLYERRSEVSPFLNSFNTKEKLLSKWNELLVKGRKVEMGRILNDRDFMGTVSDLKALAARYAGGQDAGCKYLAEVAPHLDGICKDRDVEDVCTAIVSLSAIRRKGPGSAKNFGSDHARFQMVYEELLRSYDRIGIELLDSSTNNLTDRAASLMMDLKLVFNEYQEIVRLMKRENNAIDFGDMIGVVHDLFSNDSKLVSEEFTGRYRYILLDEFQDTDSIQSDIIWMMAGKEKAAEKLFIVGDPKQSIYLFRYVDVSMFKTFQEKIVKVLGGDTVPLDTNFRSSPQVIGFVNHVFGQLMGEAKERWEYQYQEMKVFEKRQKDIGSVELLNLPDAEGSEGEFVARRIQEIVEKGKRKVYWSKDDDNGHLDEPRSAGYGDIAILLRAKTHLHEFEEALTDYGIPYRVHAGLGYFERQEITDLKNLFSFLSNKEDDLSLYGVLRSPYFALSDEELFRVAIKGHGPLWKKLCRYSSESKDPRMENIVLRLETWLHYANRISVPKLLMKVFNESGIFAVYGGLTDGDLKIANLEKLLSMARSAQSSGFLTLGDFNRWLTLSMEGGAKEGLAQLSGGDDSVKIMTVHAAKGLEFPIVIVPEMNFFRKGDSTALVYGDGIGLGIDAPVVNDGHELKPTLPKIMIELEGARKESAERKRLLYVALTRAKDHLIMCGHTPGEKEQEKELWMNWIIQTTGLNSDHITNGHIDLRKDLSFDIIANPQTIEADVVDKGVGGRLSKEELMPFITPRKSLGGIPSVMVISPSAVAHNASILELGVIMDRIESPLITCSEGAQYDELPSLRGNIVHEMLSGKDAVAVLTMYGIDNPQKVSEYSKLVEQFNEESLVKDAASAYHELAFFAKLDGEFYKGRIDLLIQCMDGSWHLIDHKTGSFEGKSGKLKIEGYLTQMSIYQKAVKALLGRDVKSYLYLVDSGEFVQIGAKQT